MADTARVHSYAYVVGVRTDYATSADPGVKVNRCDVYAKLPVAIVKERPKGEDHALLAGATAVSDRVEDPFENCESYVHTWQPVALDPASRKDVHFTWPQGNPDIGQLIIGGIVLAIIAWAIFGRFRYEWLIRRRRRRPTSKAHVK